MKHKEALIIIFVFFILLFSHAGVNSYWLDELYSVYMRGIVHESFAAHYNFMQTANPVVPLYEITLYWWMKIFGDSEVATRTLSIIYVSLSGWSLYLFTLRIFSKRIAIMTILFFLFSYLTVRYALDARYYGQMLFLTTLSSYIFLLFAESLSTCVSWKRVFINKYFIILTIVNTLLILNHTFNYLFLASQAVFLAFILFIQISDDNWFSKLFKVFSIYLSPLLLITLIWPPAMKFLFHTIETIKKIGFTNSIFHSFSQQADLNTSFFIILTLLSIGLVLIYLLMKLVYFFKKEKTAKIASKQEIRIPILFFFLMMFLVVIFLFNFGSMGLFTKNPVNSPSEILVKNIVYYSLYLPGFGLVILLLLFAIALIRQIAGLKIVNISLSKRPIIRRFFLFYLLLLILVTCIFSTIVFLIRTDAVFYPRYVLYLVPPFMLMLSLTSEQAVLLLDILKQRLTQRPIKRFYIRNGLITSVFFALIFVGPGGYRALTRSNGFSWRENSRQIVSIVESDPKHKYLIVEAVTQNFPTMDYYFKKFSTGVRVGYLLPRSAKNSLRTNKDYLPELLLDKMKIVKEYDFMVIAFNNSSKDQYLKILNIICSEYAVVLNCLNEKQYGFIIFDLHPARKPD